MRTQVFGNKVGGGYGLNKGADGARALPTAVPPYGRVRVTPGPKGHHKNVKYSRKAGS
jgi:hypothetical protein